MTQSGVAVYTAYGLGQEVPQFFLFLFTFSASSTRLASAAARVHRRDFLYPRLCVLFREAIA